MQNCFIKTPFGIAKIQGDEDGISVISILTEGDTRAKLELAKQLTIEIPKNLYEATLQIEEYFEGKRTNFTFKINPKGTEFQLKVWQELQNIAFGKTISYLDLAKKLGDPKVIRAAASANGKNPILIVIPCHRVVGSDGSLTGFSAGLWRKKWLLEHENPTNQQTLF